jgi:hypothetical protein
MFSPRRLGVGSSGHGNCERRMTGPQRRPKLLEQIGER